MGRMISTVYFPLELSVQEGPVDCQESGRWSSHLFLDILTVSVVSKVVASTAPL